MVRRVSIACCALVLLCGQTAVGQKLLIELELKGKPLAGTPIAWSSGEVLLLGRDGRLWDFPSSEVKQFSKQTAAFSSLSAGQLRAQLAREFGRRFDVSGTGHYLVVHPSGQRDRWASRFEELYRSFVHYFTARGFSVGSPEFPLVAVVFHDQAEFLSHARSQGAKLVPGTLGYYSPMSNRILLYDVTGGRQESDDGWFVNAETIIHEAAHQSAFNSGIHSRYATTPRWIVEGLGTAFEAPGVWNGRSHRSRDDRINQYQLATFRQNQEKRPTGYLTEYISSDRPFRANPAAAYAEAWAVTFFLVETRPRQYFELLRRTAARPAFAKYRPPERLKDFSEVFGKDLAILDAHFVRFVNQQP